MSHSKEYYGFNKFNLSDIFEYMNKDQFKTVFNKIVDISPQNSRYAYWNLMVPRRMSSVSESIAYEKELSEALHKKDNCFFYSNVIIDTKS